ncbi:pyruvate dehydrogenase (acetyl-transferring), homodimeric type [Dermabacter hominis]|uniref:pyruvate dehydrogenase (acetyl-transferring), homodimeric type n=1 Tax=Dermabacter hominis TaxID=36740 RepID=UPI0021A79904|nr:pyruvate dehydrogenase (acetyl-transferring), homodimeric type [Dermabacter hominis]MCT1716123.1 pyruvate dehydrogenase (acetyl-transferring), homodimeric type [Dermabacter hominis]
MRENNSVNSNDITGRQGIGLPSHANDVDPEETREWIESLDAVVANSGAERASHIVGNLLTRAREKNVDVPSVENTDYVNTIAAKDEPEYPGDLDIEKSIRRAVRWNAAMQVHRAQRPEIGVGGHLSSYASISTVYEVGFNHFFRGREHRGGGDQVFFQGHASPGIYSRAFLMGRLNEKDLDGFRQEKSNPHGIPSYPHPRAMPEFWQFPTVSMGIGPVNAIEQASINRYLHNRGLKDTSEQHVWAFLGDGEMDEVESRGALHIAANEQLDNLTFVVNCNLQRLDGPVRGNGKIIQELEAQFRGAGWNVVKVVWGEGWDKLFAADTDGALVDLMNTTPDGDFQTFRAESGGFIRDNFFGRDPRTKALVEDMSDADIWWGLKRGGHDPKKIYAAFKHATTVKNGKPTVILVHTIKGYVLGKNFAGRNATHQMKKFTIDDLKQLRDTLHIPFTDQQLEADLYNQPYYMPAEDSPEMQYMRDRRAELGGVVPDNRHTKATFTVPGEKTWAVAKRGSGKQEVATTMALVRLLKDLMRDKETGKYWVPIIPDEARTFGLDAMFPTAKIYNPKGQNYLSVDRDLLLAYKESSQGQIKHMGINEISSTSAFTAAGTAYSTHEVPLVPFYIFYSMFGFQRTGDFFYAAGDQMAKGFVIGATAGKTTLAGEGLQHMDGHSPLLAYTNPGAVIYDPAYGYEIGHIVRDGLQRMYGENEERLQEVFYYLTVYNEPIHQPVEPENVDVEGIIKGMYKVDDVQEGDGPVAQLMASGVAVPWTREARDLLYRDWGVRSAVWSVTSWSEMRNDALAADKHNFLHPEEEPRTPWMVEKLKGAEGPFVATTDFDYLVPDMIRPWMPNDYAVLGAEGWGFSDTRAAGRRYLHIDRESLVVRALKSLADQGTIDRSIVKQAIDKYDLLNVNAGSSGGAGGDA